MKAEHMMKRRKQAEIYFSKFWPNMPDHAEDFGSYCLEKWLGGRSCNTSFKFIAIDYFRKYGRKVDGILGGSCDILDSGVRANLDKLIDGADAIPDDGTNHDSFQYKHLIRYDGLTKLERCILVLTHEWGMTCEEIADCLGFTKGRIPQLKLKAETKIRAKFENL